MLLETGFDARQPLFHPGKVSTSDAARRILIRNSVNATDLVASHVMGGWGEADPAANRKALEQDEAVSSLFVVADARVRVTTDGQRKTTFIGLEDEVPE